MATDDDDIDIILGKLQSDGHDGNNLTYIDQLKKLLQGQNDPDVSCDVCQFACIATVVIADRNWA